MPAIVVGSLTFQFPEIWQAQQLDAWSYYVNQFRNLGNNVRLACSQCSAKLLCAACRTPKNAGMKCCDVVALEQATTWLIEVKDYRRSQRTKAIDLADEVALKVRDSLAVLLGAKVSANDDMEKTFAGQAVLCTSIRIVLHLEQVAKLSRLFPRAIKPADVLQRLQQLVKAIDPHPRVVEMAAMHGIPWSVS